MQMHHFASPQLIVHFPFVCSFPVQLYRTIQMLKWTWVCPVEFSSALWCGHGPFDSVRPVKTFSVFFLKFALIDIFIITTFCIGASKCGMACW